MRELLLAVALLGTACSGDSPPDPPPPLVQAEAAPLETWQERIEGAQPVAVAGDEGEGDLDAVIGEVADAMVDDLGQLLVLDRLYHELKIFDADGTYLHTVGREGQGPEELTFPRHLLRTAATELLVFDGPFRIMSLRRTDDGSYEFTGTTSMEIAIRAACLVRGRLLVHGMNPAMDLRVHRVEGLDDAAGRLVDGFAPVADEQNAIFRRRRSEGFMACSDAGDGVVLVTGEYFPGIEAFDLDGTLRWAGEIPGFAPMTFKTVESRGRVGLQQSIDPDAGGYHMVVSAITLGPSTFLVQATWETLESSRAEEPWERLESYLISAESGQIVRLQEPLPLIVDALPDGYVGVQPSPFPRVIRFQYATEDSR